MAQPIRALWASLRTEFNLLVHQALGIPVLQRWRQKEPWGLVASWVRKLVSCRFSERLSLQKWGEGEKKGGTAYEKPKDRKRMYIERPEISPIGSE